VFAKSGGHVKRLLVTDQLHDILCAIENGFAVTAHREMEQIVSNAAERGFPRLGAEP
jgi:hypothetical protein